MQVLLGANALSMQMTTLGNRQECMSDFRDPRPALQPSSVKCSLDFFLPRPDLWASWPGYNPALPDLLPVLQSPVIGYSPKIRSIPVTIHFTFNLKKFIIFFAIICFTIFRIYNEVLENAQTKTLPQALRSGTCSGTFA